jgi:hypothetical protein
MSSVRSKSLVPKILKWIGIVTAVISLILGIREVINIVRENAERKSKAAELTNEARQLALSGLYSKAWDSITEATALDDGSRQVQVELAMEWLRNARIAPGQKERTFSEIVDKLAPVLHRALDTTKREYAATVQAHIGYATFLLFKEGNTAAKPDNHFRQALRWDSSNVFANVMYGFWILYPGHGDRSLEESKRYFDAALRTGKERGYVRRLMLAAYGNSSEAASAAQLVRMANDMRKNNESLERPERMSILSKAYWLNRGTIMQEVGKLLTPDEQLQTFLFLADGIEIDNNPYYKTAYEALKKAAQQ